MKQIIFALLFSIVSFGQDTLDVIKKVDKVYYGQNFLKFDASYKLFKTKSSKSPVETYQSKFMKNVNNVFHISNKNTVSIENDKYVFQLDMINKIAALANSNVKQSSSVFKIQEISKYGKITEFKKTNNGWYLCFNVSSKANIMYNKIGIYINSNYTIQKEILHLRQAVNFSKDFRKTDMKLPVLEITFSNYSFEKINDSIFNLSNYFTIDKKNVCVLKDKYKGYKLNDLR